MGLIDNKSRLIDVIVTQEGRRQIASGKLQVEFVSFTDGDTFYEADTVSGSSDAADRIFFEVTSLPQDRITFEADDSGRLMPYPSNNIDVFGGKVISGSSAGYSEFVTGSVFTSVANELLESSINNFNSLHALRTNDAFFDDEREFILNTSTVEFTITSRVPFTKLQISEIDLEKIESLFQDKRLSHLPNFRYLPPVNKPAINGSQPTPLGQYPVIGQRITPLSNSDIERDLIKKEKRTVEFIASSKQNNIVCQLFEIKQNSVIKLDLIDFGLIRSTDGEHEKRVFFAGKVFIDNYGAQTFVNMFTLVFE